MKRYKLTVGTACKILDLPQMVCERLLREICLTDPGRNELQPFEVVILDLFSFLTRVAGLDEIAAFTTCKYVMGTVEPKKRFDAFTRMLSTELAKNNWQMEAILISVFDGRWATWPGVNAFYDTMSGVWVREKLSAPPRYHTALDIVASFMQFYRRLQYSDAQVIQPDEGTQDADTSTQDTGPANRP